jgi:cytochrome P450
MRIADIARPAGVEAVAADLASPELYTEGDPHLVWQAMRAHSPVAWHPLPGGRGFWSVTRYEDVRRVLRDHEAFSSQHGTVLDMIGVPDSAAGHMMHATDPPCHTGYRRPLERPLSTRALLDHQPLIQSMVVDAVATARPGESWDAAAALTTLPVAVVTRLMGLPPTDVELLRDAAYGSLAPHDPHYRRRSAFDTLRWSHSTLVDYFTHHYRQRQKAATADLLSYMVAMDIGGRRMSEEEVVFNCYSLLVGGVVTTGQVMSATLLTLVEQGGGSTWWPSAAPIASLIEEGLRWSSPTTHFLRTARRDVEIRGVWIRTGDPVAAWIASANRDEDVFEHPYSFRTDRRPNRHLAFGTGPHRCIGRQLARMILRELFAEFGRRVGRVTLLGEPAHLASTVIAGITRLPLAVTLRR